MTLKSAVFNTEVEDQLARHGIALVEQARENNSARADQAISGMNDPSEYLPVGAVRGLVWGIVLEVAFALVVALCWLAYRMILVSATR